MFREVVNVDTEHADCVKCNTINMRKVVGPYEYKRHVHCLQQDMTESYSCTILINYCVLQRDDKESLNISRTCCYLCLRHIMLFKNVVCMYVTRYRRRCPVKAVMRFSLAQCCAGAKKGAEESPFYFSQKQRDATCHPRRNVDAFCQEV
jgi:hypothetical protein